MTKDRRLILCAVATLALITAVRHPSANIQLLTHDARDVAPHRFHAVADLGLMGVSILVTWTGNAITH